jgi:hypothetical protein
VRRAGAPFSPSSGPTTALRDQDRDSILFDLGIDALQTDLCVRIADDAVAAQLRNRPFSLRARQSRDRRDPR